jgi:hypothetical protein
VLDSIWPGVKTLSVPRSGLSPYCSPPRLDRVIVKSLLHNGNDRRRSLGSSHLLSRILCLQWYRPYRCPKATISEGEKPGQIIQASFTKRLTWAAHLFVSPRGVGWTHEVPHLPRNPDAHNRDRAAFLISRLFILRRCGLTVLGLAVLYVVDPSVAYGVTRELNQTLLRRLVLCVLSLVISFTSMTGLHCISAIVLVGTGISTPEDWPPLYGIITTRTSGGKSLESLFSH